MTTARRDGKLEPRPRCHGVPIMRCFTWVILAGLLAGCSSSADPPPAPAPKPGGAEKAQSPTAPGPAGTAAVGTDWPCFLGPTHDNVSPEKGIPTAWPKEGLRKVWECEMGLGFAPPVVAA